MAYRVAYAMVPLVRPNQGRAGSNNIVVESLVLNESSKQFELRLIAASNAIMAATALTVGLIYLRSVLLPFAVALFVYAMASPFISLLEKRRKWPRSWAILASLSLLAISSSVFILALGLSLQSFLYDLDQYEQRLRDMFRWLIDFGSANNLPLDKEFIMGHVTNLPFFSAFQGLSGGMLDILSDLTLAVIFLIFLFLGSSSVKVVSKTVEQIQEQVAKYMVTKTIISAITGILVGIALAALNVPLALLFAMMTFALNFIPNIGSMIAVALPLPVALMQFGFGWEFALVLFVPLAIQFTVGNIIEPKILGDSMDLHPIVVLIFLMFWGTVWGLPGMFLAVPITAAMKIIFAGIPQTKAIAELMAGRWPQAKGAGYG